MSSRRKTLVLMSALLAASAFTWSLTGGVTVAQGQEKPIYINRAHEGSAKPSFDKPIFVLALGSDGASHRYGRGGRIDLLSRADSIHVIAIEPKLHKVTMIGIPRDSYVNVTCRGKSTKINEGNYFGGPKCMVDTIEAMSGGALHFDYYIATAFDFMENMVNDLGGVIVDVEPGFGSSRRVLQDHNSRAKGIRVGRVTLNGHDALAYSRDRHDYIGGDFARSRHQGLVMIGALRKARKDVGTNPGRTLEFLRTIFRNTKNDIGVVEAFKIGLLLLQVDPENVSNVVLEGSCGDVGGASVVQLDPSYRSVFQDLANDGLLSNPPHGTGC
jgi:LCP family protein required for cell wall assembly